MNELKKTTITSIEVSQMVEKKHADLLKDIRRYNSQLAEGKIPSGDFFKESTYLDVNGQERPCFQVTKARNKITQSKLAEILKITPTTLSFKLNGKSTLSLKECVEIKRQAFPDKTLDYLFATEEAG